MKYWIVWAFEMFCYCAVNCFALISGYAASQSEFKVSRIFKLWFHTVFYTVLGVAFFLIFKPEAVGKRTIPEALLPISSRQYWYISAYCGVLILSPLLNTVIRYTEKRVLGTTLLAVFVVFCTLPLIFQQQPYSLASGYSLIWLCILYLAGAYMKKYDIADKVKSSHAWFMVLGAYGVTVLSKFVIEQFLQDIPFLYAYRNSLVAYTSPTTILVSLGLLILCSKIKFKATAVRVVGFLSPAALGVYLSHSQPLVWAHVLNKSFESFTQYNGFVMVVAILSSACLVFGCGLLLDLLRIRLFALLKIHKLCARLEEKLTKSKVSKL